MGQQSSSIQYANRLYEMPLSQYGLKEKINSALSLWKHRSSPFDELIEHRVVVNSEEELNNIYDIFKMRHQHLYLCASKYLTCETQGIKGCGGFFKVKIYFESAIANLSMINDIPFNDSLHLFAVSLKGFELLYQKFGYFEVFEDMMHISENGKLKVWCNSHLYKLGPEPYLLDPYGKEDDMVYRLINLLDENVDKSEMRNIKRELFQRKNEIKTFEEVNVLFRRACRENNWQVPQRLKCIEELTKTDIDNLLMRQAEHNTFQEFLPSHRYTYARQRSPRLFNQYDREAREDITPFRWEENPHGTYEGYEERKSPRMNNSPRQKVSNITFASHSADNEIKRFPSMPELKPPSLEHTIPFNYTGRQTLVRNQDFLNNEFGKPSLRANSTVNTQNTNTKVESYPASLPKEPIIWRSMNQHEINRNIINEVQQHRLLPNFIQSSGPTPTAFLINKYNPPQISPTNINLHFTSPQTNQQILHKTNILRYQQPIIPFNFRDNQRMTQIRKPRTSINFVEKELEAKFFMRNYENNMKTLQREAVSNHFPENKMTRQENNEEIGKFLQERSTKNVFHNEDSEEERSENRINNSSVNYVENNLPQASAPSSQQSIIHNKSTIQSQFINHSYESINETPNNFPPNKECTDPKLIELLSSRDRSNITISPTFNFMVKNEPMSPINDSTLSENELCYSFNSKKKDESQESDKKMYTTIKNREMEETVVSSQNYCYTKKKYQAEIDGEIWSDLMKLKKTKNLTIF